MLAQNNHQNHQLATCDVIGRRTIGTAQMLRFPPRIPLALILATGILVSLSACNEDVYLGTSAEKVAAAGGTDSSSSGSGGSADDDADALSNEVEDSFDLDSRKADTDHDGISDGLEFVGDGGDPLNGNATPSSLNRVKILDREDIVLNDPDRDGDGLGDFFESENDLDQDDPDIDDDGYNDGIELVANSNPFDSNDRPIRDAPPASDGITRTGNAPLDSDGDGISDSLESLNGTLSSQTDSDGDGFSDGIELLMGSNETDNASVPNFGVPARPESLT
jgi:hypothetical protein